MSSAALISYLAAADPGAVGEALGRMVIPLVGLGLLAAGVIVTIRSGG